MYSLLIVDDEPMILQGMKKKIDWEAYGFTRIATENTYEGALETAIILQPSLCLIDICLGDKKGYYLIEKLKQLGVKSQYIIMSGYSEFEYARKAIQCGALEYLLKPVEPEALKRVVEKVVAVYLGGTITGGEKSAPDPILNRVTDEFPSLVLKMLMIVETDYGSTLNLKTMGEKFRMNAAYLGQIFQQETGIKFSEYLMAYRLLKARELLIHTDQKIAVVADAVGYDNMSYFYGHFKSYFGHSPTDLRGGKRREEDEKQR